MLSYFPTPIFKLYFINYVIRVVSIVPPLSPLPSTHHSLRPSLHHCSCPWVMRVSSLATPFPILHFTFPWLFCNYLFVVLNTLTSSPILPHPLPSGNHQHTLHIHHSLFSCLVSILFLGSIVDRYIFIAILLFIVLIFFLNKSL